MQNGTVFGGTRYSGECIGGFNKNGGKNVSTVFGETRYSGDLYWGFLQKRGKNGGTAFGGTQYSGGRYWGLTKAGERMLALYSGRHGIRGPSIGDSKKTGKRMVARYSGGHSFRWGVFYKNGEKNGGTVFVETRYSGDLYWGFYKNGGKNGGTAFGGTQYSGGRRGIGGFTVYCCSLNVQSHPCLSGSANLCNLFRLSEDGRVLFMSGMWDNSLRVGQVNQHEISPLTVLYQHKNVVTCMELDGKYLATGGRDTTVVVWKTLRRQGECVGMKPHPSAILYGHNSAVTCVALSQELDLVVSGSSEGSVLIHTLKLGTYIRTVVPHVPEPENEHLCVKFVGIAGNGNIVITGKIPSKNAAGGFHSVIYLYTINGKMIKRAKFEDEVGAMFLDGERVVLGGLEGSLEIRDTNYINLKHKLRLKSGVLAISKDPRNQHLFVTTSDGKLLILTPTAKAFVKK